MTDDALNLALDEQKKQTRAAKASEAKNTDKNITYFGDMARSVNSFGAGDSNPLNIIRTQAAEAMLAINSVLNPAGVFSIVKTPFEMGESFGRGLQNLLGSLISLDQMVIYQIQRVQNYRMMQTVGALTNACTEYEETNRRIHEIVNNFSDGNFLGVLIDDWQTRVDNAEYTLSRSYNQEYDILDDTWRDAEAELLAIATGSDRDDDLVAQVRELINLLQKAKRSKDDQATLWESLRSKITESQVALENIKQGVALQDAVKRAITLAIQNTGDASDLLKSIQTGCRLDPEVVVNKFSDILGKIDSSVLALNKSHFDDKFDDFDRSKIDLESACILVKYDAYLDDLALLEREFVDYESLQESADVFITSVESYLSSGDLEAKNKAVNDYSSYTGMNSSCDVYLNNANNIFDDWHDYSSDLGEGLLGSLTDLADMGTAGSSALDSILNATVFRVDSYRDFLMLTPAGRMFIIVVECLGISDELASGKEVEGYENIRGYLDSMVGEIDALSTMIAETMNSIFGYLNTIDGEVASFIAALTSLLRFCDGQTSIVSPGRYGTTIDSQITGDIGSELYNEASGSDGSNSDPTFGTLPTLGTDEFGGCSK